MSKNKIALIIGICGTVSKYIMLKLMIKMIMKVTKIASAKDGICTALIRNIFLTPHYKKSHVLYHITCIGFVKVSFDLDWRTSPSIEFINYYKIPLLLQE